MWFAFGMGVFLGTMFGIFITGLLTAGKIENTRNGNDTPK
jgi:hypothetical protein